MPRKNLYNEALKTAEQVACTKCGAEAGEMCRTNKGNVSPLPHVARRVARTEQLQNEVPKPRKKRTPNIVETKDKDNLAILAFEMGEQIGSMQKSIDNLQSLQITIRTRILEKLQ